SGGERGYASLYERDGGGAEGQGGSYGALGHGGADSPHGSYGASDGNIGATDVGDGHSNGLGYTSSSYRARDNSSIGVSGAGGGNSNGLGYGHTSGSYGASRSDTNSNSNGGGRGYAGRGNSSGSIYSRFDIARPGASGARNGAYSLGGGSQKAYRLAAAGAGATDAIAASAAGAGAESRGGSYGRSGGADSPHSSYGAGNSAGAGAASRALAGHAEVLHGAAFQAATSPATAIRPAAGHAAAIYAAGSPATARNAATGRLESVRAAIGQISAGRGAPGQPSTDRAATGPAADSPAAARYAATGLTSASQPAAGYAEAGPATASQPATGWAASGRAMPNRPEASPPSDSQPAPGRADAASGADASAPARARAGARAPADAGAAGAGRAASPVSGRLCLLFAFFVPFLIHGASFVAMGLYPFGDKSMMVIDNFHQYSPFLLEYRDILSKGGSLLYSWNSGLGSNYWARFGYYLASPLNLLFPLFPEQSLPEFIAVLSMIRTGFAGLAFFVFARAKFRRGDLACVAFASMYAMSSYTLAYYWNIMWFDCIAVLPLIVLGLERLASKRGIALYCATLAFAMYTNYYIALIICIFLALYFAAFYWSAPARISASLNSAKRRMGGKGVAGGARPGERDGRHERGELDWRDGRYERGELDWRDRQDERGERGWRSELDARDERDGLDRLNELNGLDGRNGRGGASQAGGGGRRRAMAPARGGAASRGGMRYLKNFVAQSALFAGCSLLSAGIAAVILLPSMAALSVSQSAGASFPKTISTYFSMIEILSGHLLNVTPSVMSGMPNIFCGLSALVLVPLYAANRKFAFREKLCFGLLLSFIFLSFNVNQLNFAWHGMHFPNSLPYRFSFLYVFLVATLSCRAFMNLDGLNSRYAPAKALAFAAGFILVIEKLYPERAGAGAIYPSLLFAAAYALIAVAASCSRRAAGAALGAWPAAAAGFGGAAVAGAGAGGAGGAATVAGPGAAGAAGAAGAGGAGALGAASAAGAPAAGGGGGAGAGKFGAAGEAGGAAAATDRADGAEAVATADAADAAEAGNFAIVKAKPRPAPAAYRLPPGSRSARRDRARPARYIAASALLLAVTAAELAINGASGIGAAGVGQRDNYMATLAEVKYAVEEVQASAPQDGFYRMEFLKDTVSNTPSLYGYRGASYFSSTAVLTVTDLMGKLGFRPSSAWYIYKGSTPVVNSLLSLRYLLSKEDTYSNPLYPLVDIISGVRVYENPYQLPLGFVAGAGVLDWVPSGSDVFAIQNDLLRQCADFGAARAGGASGAGAGAGAATGAGAADGAGSTGASGAGASGANGASEASASGAGAGAGTLGAATGAGAADAGFGDVLRPVAFEVKSLTNAEITRQSGATYGFRVPDGSEPGFVNLTARTPGKEPLYLYVKSRQADYVWYIKNGQSEGHNIKNYPYIIDTQYFGETEEVEVSLKFEESLSGEFEIYGSVLDEAAFKKACAALASQPLEITSFSDSAIAGVVSAERPGALFTSIPYDRGWRVEVDGRRLARDEIGSVGDEGFIAFEIGEGRHSVAFDYTPVMFREGLAVSLICLAAFAAVLAGPRLRARRAAGKAAANAKAAAAGRARAARRALAP
ncbi:MAG: YfhO family protein, partial [Clostridiales bacterium]|nr:YfhO family protein [Clostridiales bacterium]